MKFHKLSTTDQLVLDTHGRGRQCVESDRLRSFVLRHWDELTFILLKLLCRSEGRSHLKLRTLRYKDLFTRNITFFFPMRGFNLMFTSCFIYIRFLHQEHDKSYLMETKQKVA